MTGARQVGWTDTCAATGWLDSGRAGPGTSDSGWRECSSLGGKAGGSSIIGGIAASRGCATNWLECSTGTAAARGWLGCMDLGTHCWARRTGTGATVINRETRQIANMKSMVTCFFHCSPQLLPNYTHACVIPSASPCLVYPNSMFQFAATVSNVNPQLYVDSWLEAGACLVTLLPLNSKLLLRVSG